MVSFLSLFLPFSVELSTEYKFIQFSEDREGQKQTQLMYGRNISSSRILKFAQNIYPAHSLWVRSGNGKGNGNELGNGRNQTRPGKKDKAKGKYLTACLPTHPIYTLCNSLNSYHKPRI